VNHAAIMVLVAGAEAATVAQSPASSLEETVSELGRDWTRGKVMFRTCFEVLMAIIGLAILRPGAKHPKLVPDMPNPPPPPPKKKKRNWGP
jgi:hypothetical protein